MKPNLKQLDEFVLDLIEFLGKHFSSAFNKTKLGGGNEGVSVTVKNEAFGSELRIDVVRTGIRMQLGSAEWGLEGFQETSALFTDTINDVLAVLGNKIVLIAGYQGEKPTGCLHYRLTYHPL